MQFCCHNYEMLFISAQWRLETFKMPEEKRIVWVALGAKKLFCHSSRGWQSKTNMLVWLGSSGFHSHILDKFSHDRENECSLQCLIIKLILSWRLQSGLHLLSLWNPKTLYWFPSSCYDKIVDRIKLRKDSFIFAQVQIYCLPCRGKHCGRVMKHLIILHLHSRNREKWILMLS